MSAEPETAAYKRLRWRCRRGAKELDLLLEGFLSADPELDTAEMAALERLLECEDAPLQAWLIGGESPRDRELLRIVERIRRTDLSAPR